MSGIDDPKNAIVGLPTIGTISTTTIGNDAHAQAIDRAVRQLDGMVDAARVLLAFGGIALKGAGIPLGSTATDLARAALDAATEKRT